MSFYNLLGLISVHELAECPVLGRASEKFGDRLYTGFELWIILALITDDSFSSNAAVHIRRTKVMARTAEVLTKINNIQCWDSISQSLRILENKGCLRGSSYFVVESNPDPLVDCCTTQFPGRKNGIFSQSAIDYRLEAVQE